MKYREPLIEEDVTRLMIKFLTYPVPVAQTSKGVRPPREFRA